MQCWDSSKSNIYIQASLWGAVRGLSGLPFEQPLDVIKTTAQAEGYKPKRYMNHIITEIFQQRGWKGFYVGIYPNAIRVATKQAYRMPMVLGFSHFYEQQLVRATGDSHPYVVSVLTGGSLAFVETFMICPLERLKVWLITHPGPDGWRSLKSNVRRQGFQELFTGLKAVGIKQGASWITYTLAETKFKLLAYTYTQTRPLPFHVLMGVSLGVGIINTLVVHPLDVVKTLHQKNSHQRCNVWNTLKELVKKQGIRGLYPGWQAKIIQYMIQSIFTVSLLDKLKQQEKGK